jgi:hypothetical protein
MQTHAELSIYTMKPDIIVLFKFQGRIMFFVNVKSPEHEHDNNRKNAVHDSKNVASQIWSYLYSMKALGVKHPMGAIMTYNRLSLVSLDDLSACEEHKVKVEITRKVLASDTVIAVTGVPEGMEECIGWKSSPSKDAMSLTEMTQRKREQMDLDIFQDEEPAPVTREVYRSRVVYEKGMVFPSLVQALHIAYQYAKETSVTKVLRLENGEDIGGCLVFYVGPASFD